MALEAVVFSQDHPLSSYNSCRDQFNFFNSGVGLGCPSLSYDLIQQSYSNPFESNIIHNVHNQFWDDEQQYVNSGFNSSPDEERHGNCTSVEQYLSGEAEAPQPSPAAIAITNEDGGSSGGRRKRRRRSCKNKEEVEQQRMTHIAVERNRRKQMNEYLAVIRSLMPPSYVQRGDQASIVGGAINYVKELEQLLQSLEANKRTKLHHDNHHEQPEKQPQPPSEPPAEGGGMSISDFTGLPSFPHSNQPMSSSSSSCNSSVSSNNNNNMMMMMMMNKSGAGGDEVQVTMVESHANVKILAKKQPKQLLRLVAGFQGLRLSVLHLNVTSLLSHFLLYSFSLKVEEGCQLNTVDDITAAANHILSQVQEEVGGLR